MSSSKSSRHSTENKIEDQVKRVAGQAQDILGKVKAAYASLDPETKKKIKVGLAGVGALLAGIAVAKKAKKARARSQKGL